MPSETPDGRPGVIIMVVSPVEETDKEQPYRKDRRMRSHAATTAVFNALESEETVPSNSTSLATGTSIRPRLGDETCGQSPYSKESSSVRRPMACKKV